MRVMLEGRLRPGASKEFIKSIEGTHEKDHNMRVLLFDKVVGDNHFVFVAEFEHGEDFQRLLVRFAPHAKMRFKLLGRIFRSPEDTKREGGDAR